MQRGIIELIIGQVLQIHFILEELDKAIEYASAVTINNMKAKDAVRKLKYLK